MYAVIECGGKQYRVQEGDLIKVEKLTAEVDSSFEIDKVLLIGGETTLIGTPYVEGATVYCKVMHHDKDKKILVFHYKAKKNIRKRYGHRQPFTSLLVEKIVKDGISSSTETKAAKKNVKASKEETAAATEAEEPKKTRTRKTTKKESVEA
jgi:large subunit ribosomal protein L21